MIEEAPAPGMDETTRAAVCDAAVRAARAVDYEGAGTIEFIADASEGLRADRIWFMEMNTRLQVEHPVTEEITGVDLVEWQLRVASGETLPKRQDELSITGHAIEARLYAEDPANGFLPSTGPLDRLFLDADRIETGVEEGDEVSPHYDPMIAKLVVHDETREDAIAALAQCCEATEVWPVKTNAGFLARLLHQPVFQSGDMTTGFIASLQDDVTEKPELGKGTQSAVARCLIANYADRAASHAGLLNFRLNRSAKADLDARIDGEPATLPVSGPGHGHGHGEADLMSVAGGGFIVFDRGFAYAISRRAMGAGQGAASDGAILSPMPGKIIAVGVAAGDTVTKGQTLLTLEAMKMEHSLVAPFDGIVAELNAKLGGQVSEGTVLAEINADVDGDD